MDFAAGVYVSEAQNPIPPLPPYTLYTCIHSILIRSRGGGGRVKTREVTGVTITKLG
jgi:hypothetical protein